MFPCLGAGAVVLVLVLILMIIQPFVNQIAALAKNGASNKKFNLSQYARRGEGEKWTGCFYFCFLNI
jgi:hypothetical protein